jgi:hypothetical protein
MDRGRDISFPNYLNSSEKREKIIIKKKEERTKKLQGSDSHGMEDPGGLYFSQIIYLNLKKFR